jgi:hypothetical protein
LAALGAFIITRTTAFLVRLFDGPVKLDGQKTERILDLENQLQKEGLQRSTVLAMHIDVFGFLTESPSDRGAYKLYLNLKALETVGLTRITVLFNRRGGNGSYQLAAYASPHTMHQPEFGPVCLAWSRWFSRRRFFAGIALASKPSGDGNCERG